MAQDGQSQRLTILLSVALVGVVLFGIGIAVYLGRRHPQTSTGNASVVASMGAVGPPAASPAATSADVATASADVATAGTAGAGVAATAASGDTVVRISESASGHPQAIAIRTLVQRNFDAINNRDYALFAATTTSVKDEATWRTEYASTRDSDIMVHQILAGDHGATQIRMSFISEQSAELAPTDLPVGCIAWSVLYSIDDNAGTLTIGGSDAAQASKKACG